MAFALSPGINVSEIDLTTIVPSVATTDGAFAGVFRWGPVGERVLIDNEDRLVARFAKPTSFNAETFFTAANFLSYSNRLYISRAANTSGVTPQLDIGFTNNSNIYTASNTEELSVGMYVYFSNTDNVSYGNSVYITSVNSSAIIMSANAANQTGTAALYFASPATTYSAVGLETNGIVSNLVNQVVKSESHYTGSKDGTFDSDVVYVARYPGYIGNSLRVSVCDSANAYTSMISASNGAAVNNQLEFRIGSQFATVKYEGTANTTGNTVALNFQVGDKIVAGNNTIGFQYLNIKSITTASNPAGTTAFSFNANSDVNPAANFIRIAGNKFSNGDVVTYSLDAGGTNTALTSLVPLTNYHVVEANTSGIKLSTTPFGSAIDITTGGVSENGHFFTSNTSTLVFQFEDPYRLHTNFTTNTIQRFWEFQNLVGVAPGQSDFIRFNGNTAANDELHVVVVDDGGLFTGTPGTVLEIFKGLSRASDSKNNDNSANYYKTVINDSSQYIWFANDRSGSPSATSLNVTSSTNSKVGDYRFAFGADGYAEDHPSVFATVAGGYDLFQSVENSDISLVLQGKPIGGIGATYQLANYIIDNVGEIRKDCVAFISPDRSTVLNNEGFETASLKSWRDNVRSTSYAVLDSGYKYQYDRYNDVYRWIPLNGDIAGLCARTDQSNDAWWSPAGFNRGQIKNLVKLAYNPRKAERDVIYTNGINPVVTFPGQGTILYGDKTLLAKPSAFDRINVRRLFIVLEKAISQAAKYSLFEFNDDFTRAQFKNLVTPYLRTIQGRRGITDFLVVCDDTNNTAQIIDSNQFVGDIYVKPARSINFIQLNFVAVGTGVQFSEVVGRF